MQDTQAFAPFYRVTVPGAQTGGFLPSVTVACTASSAVASGALAPENSGGSSIQVANTTNGWAYVNMGVLGALSAATVAAGYPVAPGAVVAISVAPEVTGASVILGSGTGNVVFTRGNGV